ncbi:MAG: phage head morphogenesis protein [Pelagimonas sp.]|jgi:hypothetical protein|nr:phage head morphogenesis protein [Pelagimonas sp.]
MTDLQAVFHRPFKEQVAAWRLRMGNQIPTARWDDIQKAQHDRSFMVAGALKADLLADLAGAVDKAITKGASLEEFRRDFRKIVKERGWHGWTGEGTQAGENWRTRIIYRTNMRTSYMAGRYAQLMSGPFPLWVYKHGGSADPRPHHLALDGLVLPREHPFWQTHFPPNDWNCSCSVTGARNERHARRKGGDPSKALPENWDRINERTGEPGDLGKGWGYAPGASVAGEITRLAKAKAEKLPPQIASDFVEAVEKRAGIRQATSLKDAEKLVEELGLASRKVAWPRGASLEGVNQAIEALHEIEQRFDMRKMQAVGSGPAIAKLSNGRIKAPKNAAAWYAMRLNVMGWHRAGLSVDPHPQADLMEPMQERRRARHKAMVSRFKDGAAKRAAQKVDWRFGVVDEGPRFPRSVAQHESGHRLHASFYEQVEEAINGWRQEGWHLALSEYGATDRFEFVAESFVLYMMGPERHWRLKPSLLALFKKLDKAYAD